jgi:integrase
MAALRVARLDLRRSRAGIVESVTPVQDLGLVWGAPRPTSVARCRSPVPGRRARRARHRQQPDDPVFAGIRNGQPLRVSTFRTAFSVAARAIGVPDLHPHQLRHTAASLAIVSGADVKVVQQRSPFRAEMPKRPLPAFPLVRTVSDEYPRPDSNRRYRLERAAC